MKNNQIYSELIMKKQTSIKKVKGQPAKYFKYIADSVENKLAQNFIYLSQTFFLPNPIILEKSYLQADQEKTYVFSEAIVGLQHRQPSIKLPCQDAVNAVLKPRPILVLCDGAGSATVSEIGAHELVVQLTRLSQTLDPLIASYLDQKSTFDGIPLVRIFIRHAMGILQDCAVKYKRSIQDFKSTLNFVVMGKEQFLWIKAGDGEIIQEKIYTRENDGLLHTEYQCLGRADKGEFANQTQFIDDRLQLTDVQWGLIRLKI